MTSNRVVEIENWINDSILVAKRINAVVLLVFAYTCILPVAFSQDSTNSVFAPDTAAN